MRWEISYRCGFVLFFCYCQGGSAATAALAGEGSEQAEAEAQRGDQ